MQPLLLKSLPWASSVAVYHSCLSSTLMSTSVTGAFCRHLPQFSRTYTVKTRRGFHLYFRVRERVPSHQFDGGDIKGERSYVIAPPSVIGGFEYRPVCDFEVMKLEKADVGRLLGIFT